MNNFMFLENAGPKPPVYEPGWYVAMIILLVILVSPWIFVIFKYGIFRKLRVRFIISNDEELPALFLKKGAKIVLPEAPLKEGKKFVGWFIDEDLTEEFIDIPMPNKNIKLYAKYE